MKIKIKMKKRSYRYNINRLRPRHEDRYTKYKISNILKTNSRLKLAKNQAKAKQHLVIELSLFEYYLLSSSTFIIQK